MKEFIDTYENWELKFGLKLEIYHSSIVDWCIRVGFKHKTDIILNIQESDLELAFAKAQIKLKEWLLENNGGY
jgi:hypothetical protein